MMRQIFAVLAGFAVWTVLWLGTNAGLTAALPEIFHEDGSVGSTGILILVTALSVLFSWIAGFTTGTMSTEHETKPVLTLAVIQVAIGIAVEIAYWDVLPLWYHLAFVGLLAPAILVGGRMAMRRKRGELPA